MTTSQNLQQHFAQIDADLLPKTILHTVQLVHKLGIDYLWIDALCIIQPSHGDSSDWDKESAMMGEVNLYLFQHLPALVSRDQANPGSSYLSHLFIL